MFLALVAVKKSICPICSADILNVIGNRNRTALDSKGERLTIVIRRLRLLNPTNTVSSYEH